MFVSLCVFVCAQAILTLLVGLLFVCTLRILFSFLIVCHVDCITDELEDVFVNDPNSNVRGEKDSFTRGEKDFFAMEGEKAGKKRMLAPIPLITSQPYMEFLLSLQHSTLTPQNIY